MKKWHQILLKVLLSLEKQLYWWERSNPSSPNKRPPLVRLWSCRSEISKSPSCTPRTWSIRKEKRTNLKSSKIKWVLMTAFSHQVSWARRKTVSRLSWITISILRWSSKKNKRRKCLIIWRASFAWLSFSERKLSHHCETWFRRQSM